MMTANLGSIVLTAADLLALRGLGIPHLGCLIQGRDAASFS